MFGESDRAMMGLADPIGYTIMPDPYNKPTGAPSYNPNTTAINTIMGALAPVGQSSPAMNFNSPFSAYSNEPSYYAPRGRSILSQMYPDVFRL